MAALDGKIEIGIEYRPCIVSIPEMVEEHRNVNRQVISRVLKEAEEHKALFHCWGYRSEPYDALPMIGGHPGGQVSETFAIVEYEDGTVHEVKPRNIRFVDNLINEFAFPGME